MGEFFDRRQFLSLTGTAAVALASGSLLAAGGGGNRARVAAASLSKTAPAGARRKVKLGFIALTDCAPLVMAKELGFYADQGLDVELVKQASWPATRDNLLSGQIDGAHCLFAMPFSVASGVSGSGTDLKIAMILNNNGQAVTLSKDLRDAGYGNLAAARDLLDRRSPTLAMTYPGGTHDLWLRYWLRATGADASRVKVVPVPPAQMVANMTVGNMDGYCVGEPWNAVAVARGIGFTHLASQDLWLNHPEKALVVNAGTAGDDALTTDLIVATLKACKWLDDLANRAKAAGTIGAPNYVNAPAADIEGRLLGRYDLGAGLGSKDFKGHQMMFHRGGATNAPRRSYGYWVLAQYQRLGLLKSEPHYAGIVDAVVLRDLYAQAASKAGVSVPDDDMKPFDVVLDHTTFDPNHPAQEVLRA